MSTWTNRSLAALLVALLLAGCVEAGAALGFRPAPERMAVLDGSVTVAGPRGYCVDLAGSRDSDTSAFVLMGSCASLSGSPLKPSPRKPVILTASVLAGGAEVAAAAPEALDAFFRSEAGRAALSRDGEAGTVEVAETFKRGDAFFLRARDLSDASGGPPVEAEYWRAVMALNGRLLTLSAFGLRSRPQSVEDKRAALEGFLSRMLALNPARAVAAPAVAVATGPAVTGSNAPVARSPRPWPRPAA